MAKSTDGPQIAIRVESTFREQIQAEADARYEGNVAMFIREALRAHLRLRQRFGNTLDIMLDAWLADPIPLGLRPDGPDAEREVA